MDKKTKIFSRIFSFCLYSIAYNTIYCMEFVVEQPQDPHLTEIRKNMGKGIFTEKVPRTIYTEQFTERLGKCLAYALSTILDINPGLLKIINTADWANNINLAQYFEPTNNPQKNDLVIYYADCMSTEPLHFGVVTTLNPENNQPLIASKWGLRPEIFEHEPFAVPLIYGNCIRYFRLKDEYLQPAKANLIKKIQQSINASEISQKSFFLLQFALLQLANGKDISTVEKALHINKQSSPVGKMLFLLKEYPGLNINIPNKTGATPLMLAAQRNDYAMVNFLLQYGADVHKKDNLGNTALSKTTDANITLLLKQYGAI